MLLASCPQLQHASSTFECLLYIRQAPVWIEGKFVVSKRKRRPGSCARLCTGVRAHEQGDHFRTRFWHCVFQIDAVLPKSCSLQELVMHVFRVHQSVLETSVKADTPHRCIRMHPSRVFYNRKGEREHKPLKTKQACNLEASTCTYFDSRSNI